MINVILNGKKSALEKTMSISELLKLKKIKPEVVTIELNDSIIDKKKFKATSIKEGDRIEFVYFMGGGC